MPKNKHCITGKIIPLWEELRVGLSKRIHRYHYSMSGTTNRTVHQYYIAELSPQRWDPSHDHFNRKKKCSTNKLPS